MSLFLPLYAAILSALPYTQGYASGAPQNLCGPTGTMLPGHGYTQQPSTTNPYTLSASNGQTTYTMGEVITLTLNGGGNSFEGFLIQASAVNTINGQIVGTMTAAPGSRLLFCGGNGFNGLTHIDKTAKASFTFQWTAPDPAVYGDITFFATVVKDFGTYWVKDELLTLMPGSGSVTPGGSPGTHAPVTPQPQTTAVSPTDSQQLTTQPQSQGVSILYDPQCGVTKGCFADCNNNDCSFLVTWKDLGSAVQFELYGKPDRSFEDAWVAVGFSDDNKMGNDSVTECVYSNGMISAFNSYNTGYSNNRLDNPQFGLSHVQGSYANGVLSCTFIRRKLIPKIPQMFDLDHKWRLIVANGRVLPVPAWQLYMHSTIDLPPVTPVEADLQSVHVITSKPKTSVESTEPPSRPKIQSGQILYDPDCGFSKGCFVNCKGNDCAYMVTWKDLGTAVQFELYGKPDRSFTDAWVAVGFSDDTRMGGDSVTECVYSNGIIQAFNSYNTGYSNRRLNNPQFGLSNVAGSYYDGVLACTFIRQKSVSLDSKMYDLERDWHLMFANGRVLQVPAWQLYMHSTSDLPPTTAAKVDLQSFVVIGSAAKFPLAKAHGCLMIIAWVLFTSIGIVAARYYKNVWADKTFLKLKIWFQIHRACMVSALAFDVLAFILIFIEVKGYSNIPDIPGKSYLRSHPVLGIIVTILCVANPVMALFRPGPDHDKRWLFNWTHWGVGMTAYILSAITICFGFKLGKTSTPDYAIYIMIVYVVYIIVFDILFEVMECVSKRERKVKVDGMEMENRNGTDNGNIPNGNHVTKETKRKNDKVKTMLLAIHIAFTGAFALVLVLVVALN